MSNDAFKDANAFADPVILLVEDGLARIILNRPERMNAFDDVTARQWAEKTQEAVARPDVKAVLLQGEGRGFCAGGDVRKMATFDDREDELRSLARVINTGLLNLLRSNIPVVAAAHGTTAGGGLGVLLSSDIAVVGESSKIGSLYAAVGLTPDLSVSALLGRAVGERRALNLTLQNKLISAAEALEWGLVAEVVPDDQVLSRAEEIAKHWIDNASVAYGEAKRLVRSSFDRTLEEQLEEEAATIARASVAPEAAYLIKKFASK